MLKEEKGYKNSHSSDHCSNDLINNLLEEVKYFEIDRKRF